MFKEFYEKPEFTILDYYLPYYGDCATMIASDIKSIQRVIEYYEVMIPNFRSISDNIRGALNILIEAEPNYTMIDDYIKIRVRKLNEGMLIIEIQTTYPIINSKQIESKLSQERGLARVAYTHEPTVNPTF